MRNDATNNRRPYLSRKALDRDRKVDGAIWDTQNATIHMTQ